MQYLERIWGICGVSLRNKKERYFLHNLTVTLPAAGNQPRETVRNIFLLH